MGVLDFCIDLADILSEVLLCQIISFFLLHSMLNIGLEPLRSFEIKIVKCYNKIKIKKIKNNKHK